MPKEEMQLVPYDLEIATIEGLKAKYMDIAIQPEDKAAYAMVMSGLRECREIRLDVDAWHKDKKALIVKAGNYYDQEKRRVHGLVEPIETHLKDVRQVEDGRVEAIKAEKIRLEQERVEGIRAKIQRFRAMAEIDPALLSDHIQALVDIIDKTRITEEVYQEYFKDALLALSASRAIIEERLKARVGWEMEQAAAKAESERLEKVRKEQEAEAAKLKAAEDKIDAEKTALEAEKKAEQERKDREAFEAKAKEEARIQAQKEAEEIAKERMARERAQIEREAREAKEKAEAEAAEKARQEALRPDKDKIITWARELNQRLLDMSPDLSSPEAKKIIAEAEGKIDKITGAAVKQAKEL